MWTRQTTNLGPVMGLLVTGCYASSWQAPLDAAGDAAREAAPDAAVRGDRRLCDADDDCRPGESCVTFAREPERLCALPCPQMYLRCDNGLICSPPDDPIPPTIGAGFCFPGAERPGGPCDNRFDCGPGLVCSKIGRRLQGECLDLYCERTSDCEPGFLCRFGACHPVCDERDPDVCPAGTVCFEGWCETEEQALATYCWTGTEFSLRCELGEACVRNGRDASLVCSSIEMQSEWQSCPEGTVWTGLTDGCVAPRR